MSKNTPIEVPFLEEDLKQLQDRVSPKNLAALSAQVRDRKYPTIKAFLEWLEPENKAEILKTDHQHTGTPLIMAIASGSTQMVELFLQHGADINQTTKHHTPLGKAVQYKYPEVLDFLLSRGANPFKTPENYTDIQTKLLTELASPNFTFPNFSESLLKEIENCYSSDNNHNEISIVNINPITIPKGMMVPAYASRVPQVLEKQRIESYRSVATTGLENTALSLLHSDIWMVITSFLTEKDRGILSQTCKAFYTEAIKSSLELSKSWGNSHDSWSKKIAEEMQKNPEEQDKVFTNICQSISKQSMLK